MTLELTAEDLADLQDDLDLGDQELVLTDARLNRAYNRAGGELLKTRVYAWRWLEVQAMKLYNTSTGLMRQERGVIFERVKAKRIESEKEAGMFNGAMRMATFGLGINEPDLVTEDADEIGD